MENQAPEIVRCEAVQCVYNRGGRCHAIAITVGDHAPLCDTFFQVEGCGGFDDVVPRVGACKVRRCGFNRAYECGAPGITMKMICCRSTCGTFQTAKTTTRSHPF